MGPFIVTRLFRSLVDDPGNTFYEVRYPMCLSGTLDPLLRSFVGADKSATAKQFTISRRALSRFEILVVSGHSSEMMSVSRSWIILG